MMLNSSQIRVLVQKERLVYGFLDLEKQLQPASFDMTLGKVFGFAGAGAIDFDNSQRKIPAAEEIPFGADGWVELPKGIYKLQ